MNDAGPPGQHPVEASGGAGRQRAAAPSASSKPQQPAPSNMPHQPTQGVPTANGTSASAPLLKALQASAGSGTLTPAADMQVQQRPQNGAAGPKAAPAAPAAAAAGAPAAAPRRPAQQPEPRPSQNTAALASPATQPVAATLAACPAAGARPAAAAAASAGPPSPGQAAAADLEGILTRIAQLDTEGWFRRPVREVDAPNYYKIIKQPMCFEFMRSKIRNRQYVNWQELVRDFELICSNAMKYNQRRSRVHKQALVMLRAGKKLLVEMEPEGRRAVAAMLAAGGAAAPGSVQLTPADSQAVPSSLFRSGTAGTTPTAAMLRSQSTADTATTEAESEPMQLDGPAGASGAAAGEADMGDPAGYSSYEETDLDGEGDEEQGSQRQQQQQLLEYARDAVLSQPWGSVAGAAAAGPAALAAGQAGEEGVSKERQQQEQQPAAGAAAGAAPTGGGSAHSKDWRQVRRGVEWRVLWLEHRLTELQHQRRRYQQQLGMEQQREAAAQGEQQQEQQAAAQQQQEAHAPQLRQHRQRLQLPELQLPGLLQHPFIAEHSVLGARQRTATAATEAGEQQLEPASAAGAAGSGAGAALPAAMECDDFPAEAHAALDLLDQKLSSLRRQLVALQKPATQAALQRVQAVRVPGYRGVGQQQRRGFGGGGGGGFTPRSGGATPRGTPRSNSLYRDSSLLAKRRRVQEYDMGELITPLGAPKFVERAQVKTIDTPRVRVLANPEIKKRQAAVEQYELKLKEGEVSKEAAEAIDALCPGESSGEEDTSDEAYLARHQEMEAVERERYEAVLGAAVKRNKQQSTKLGKDRSKQQQLPGLRPAVSRALSAPALEAGMGGSGNLATPGSNMLLGVASAPVAMHASVASPRAAAFSSNGSKHAHAAVGGAATPSTAGTLAAPAAAAAATPASGDGILQRQQQQQGAAAAPAAQPQLPPLPVPVQPAVPNMGAKPAGAAPHSAANTSLTGPNGMPLVMIPMNAATYAHMAQQMVAAAAAANHAAAGKQGGGAGMGSSAAAAAAAAAASSAAMMRQPFALTPAMAAAMAAAGGGSLAAAAQQAAVRQANAAMAAMAAAADPHAGLPPALQAIIPSAAPPSTNGGSGRPRGRPARQPGRPRR